MRGHTLQKFKVSSEISIMFMMLEAMNPSGGKNNMARVIQIQATRQDVAPFANLSLIFKDISPLHWMYAA